MKFVLASKNKKKLLELQNIAKRLNIEIVLLSDLGDFPEVEETGKTFEENALIKARDALSRTGLPAIADDSGLEVDALGGAPGVYSARYAEGSDADRIKKLLHNLKDVPDDMRTGRFVCAMACVLPGGREINFRGTVEGVIAREMSGEGGFGYDPVFYIPEYKMTYSQMSAELKNKISHRAIAMDKLAEELIKIIENEEPK